MTSPYATGMAVLTAEMERQMPDTGSAIRPGVLPQTPNLDENGDVIDAASGPEVYAGPCTIADPTSAQISGRTSNDESGVPNTRTLKVPHRADLRPGDLFTINSSAYAPGLVGDTFLVLGEEERSYATHRRYVLRGSSWASATTTG